MADFRETRLADRDRAAQLSLRHDHDSIGKVPNLGEIGRQKENGDTFGALGDEPIADRSDGPNVETAGGMTGKNDGGVIAEFAGNNEFLLIAAGKIGHARPRPGGADIVGPDRVQRRLGRHQTPQKSEA